MGTTDKKKRRIIIIIVGLAALAWMLWPGQEQSGNGTDDVADDGGLQQEMINRLWIDKLPKSMTDKIDVLAFIDDPYIGVFQNTSAYEGDFSAFEWRPDEKETGKIRILMLQTEKAHKMKYRVDNKDCGRFDLCVRVKGAPRGGKRYYSMEDWVINSSQKLDGDALRAQIRERIFEARR